MKIKLDDESNSEISSDESDENITEEKKKEKI